MSHTSCFLQVTGDSRKASTETSWKLWPPSETLVESSWTVLSASKGICAEYSLQDGLKFYFLHLTFEVDFRKQHCLWNIFEAHYSWKHVEIPAPEISLCFTPRPEVAGENFLCVQVWVKSCCHGGCHVLSYKDRKSSSYTDHVLFVSHVCTWKLFVWKRKKKIKKQTDKTKQINQGHPTRI